MCNENKKLNLKRKQFSCNNIAAAAAPAKKKKEIKKSGERRSEIEKSLVFLRN